MYAAQTATAARAFCPPLPATAHGHCPAENEPMCVCRTRNRTLAENTAVMTFFAMTAGIL